MPYLAKEHLDIPTQDILSVSWANRHAFDQNKPIYVDCATGQSLSGNDVWPLIRQAIAGFRALGVQKGDVVCIHAFNNIWYPILVFGIIGAGGIYMGTNPAYTKYELEHGLGKGKAKFVISDLEVFDNIASVAKARGIPDERILVLAEPDDLRKTGGNAAKHSSWRSLLNHGSQDWLALNDLKTAQDTPAYYLFSSGTTGLPKPVQQSHHNIVAHHKLIVENPAHPIGPDWSRLACLPFFHASTVPLVFGSVLLSGMTAFVMRRFQLPQFLDYAEQYQAKQSVLVPLMAQAIVGLAESSPENAQMVRRKLRHFRSMWSSAAPLSRDMQLRFQALLPDDAPFTQLWACTENTCVGITSYTHNFDSSGSSGRPIPNLDIKIIDDAGKEVAEGERGELCVRGPTVSKGYLDNPQANAESWDSEGYYHSGDIVFRDPKDEKYYVVDRKKELIKVRGFQVAPAELEALLLTHPKIRDAAVVGVPDERSGELPRAYIIKKEGVDLTESEVADQVRKHLIKYKHLEGGVKFVDTLPRNASGKLLKRHIREMAKAEMGPRQSKL